MIRSPVADSLESHLPDLRFVPTASILPHEQPDPQRLEPLVRKLREQSELRNPPIVTPLAGDGTAAARYVVLDGANRATAAQVAGFPHMLVQVVPYAGSHVTLSTWNHALSHYPHAEMQRSLDGTPGLGSTVTDLLHARAALARREALAWIQFEDGAVLTLHGGTTIRERTSGSSIVAMGAPLRIVCSPRRLIHTLRRPSWAAGARSWNGLAPTCTWRARVQLLNRSSSSAPRSMRFLVRGKPAVLLHTPVSPSCALSMKSPR